MVDLEPLRRVRGRESTLQAPDREPRSSTPARSAPQEILAAWAQYRAEVRQGVPEGIPPRAGRARAEESRGLAWARSPGSSSTSGSRSRTSRRKRARSTTASSTAPVRRRRRRAGRALHGLRHPVLHEGCPVNNIIPDWNDLVYRQDWKTRDRHAALDQQLPRVHRPHLPGAVRGSLRAAHQRRPGRHQVDRARDHRQGLGRRLGARAAGGAQDRQEGRGGRLGPAPASPARSSSRAPATTSRCSRRATASAGCCATASRTSRWRRR